MDLIKLLRFWKRKKKRALGLKVDRIDDAQMRFGTLVVEKGFVAPEQVVEAMIIQVKEDIEMREHRPIGKILLDQGLINSLKIEEVLETLERQDLDI